MLFQWALLAMTNAVRYKDCGTEGITLESVDVTPCPIEPCELHKGSNYSIAVHFDEDIEDELSLSLCGYIGPVCVPFPTDTPKQKIIPGENTFKLTMPIEPAYPSMKVVGKFRLESDQTDNKVCFMIPLKIMPNAKKLTYEPNDHQHL